MKTESQQSLDIGKAVTYTRAIKAKSPETYAFILSKSTNLNQPFQSGYENIQEELREVNKQLLPLYYYFKDYITLKEFLRPLMKKRKLTYEGARGAVESILFKEALRTPKVRLESQKVLLKGREDLLRLALKEYEEA